MRSLLWTLGVSGVGVFLWAWASASSAVPAAPRATSTPSISAPTWVYAEQADEMGRGTIKYAELQSTNAVTFRWPYHGRQHATLTLRTWPAQGNDVMLRLPHAHFLCPSYNDSCRVTVRLDAGKPQIYSAGTPDDHSTSMIFIRGYDRLVSQLERAQTLRIEANFYQDGRRVFEFPVAGLTWASPAKGKRAAAKTTTSRRPCDEPRPSHLPAVYKDNYCAR